MRQIVLRYALPNFRLPAKAGLIVLQLSRNVKTLESHLVPVPELLSRLRESRINFGRRVNIFMKLFVFCAVSSISIILGTADVASAASDTDAMQFASASTSVNSKGELLSADAVESAIPGGTLVAPRVVFPSWSGGQKNDYDFMKIEGHSSFVQADGTELRFNGGKYERSTSRLTFLDGASVDVVFARTDGMKTGATTTYSCHFNHLLADGVDTGMTSVCLVGGTRLYCDSRGRLRAQTWAPFCQTP